MRLICDLAKVLSLISTFPKTLVLPPQNASESVNLGANANTTVRFHARAGEVIVFSARLTFTIILFGTVNKSGVGGNRIIELGLSSPVDFLDENRSVSIKLSQDIRAINIATSGAQLISFWRLSNLPTEV